MDDLFVAFLGVIMLVIAGVLEMSKNWEGGGRSANKNLQLERTKKTILENTEDQQTLDRIVIAREDRHDRFRFPKKIEAVVERGPKCAYEAFSVAAQSDDEGIRSVGLAGLQRQGTPQAVSLFS